VVAIALAVLAAAGVGLASASTVSVAAVGVTNQDVSRPCPGVATAVPADLRFGTSYYAVAITLPSGCGPRTVDLNLLDGRRWRSGSAVIDGSGTITLSRRYTARTSMTIVATLDGWDLPVAWSFAPATCIVPTGAASCAADVTVFVGNKPGGGYFTYYDVAVTTTSTTPVPWQVTILMSHPDLPGVPTYLGNSTLDGYNDGLVTWSGTGDVNDVQRVSACSDSPILVVNGKPSGPANDRYETVVAGRARLFSLVLNYDYAPYTDVFSPGCT
jgi:hypothetical protein